MSVSPKCMVSFVSSILNDGNISSHNTKKGTPYQKVKRKRVYLLLLCISANLINPYVTNTLTDFVCTILKVSGLRNPIIIWKSYLTLYTGRNVSCVCYLSFCKALLSISLLPTIIIVRQFIKYQFIGGNLANFPNKQYIVFPFESLIMLL